MKDKKALARLGSALIAQVAMIAEIDIANDTIASLTPSAADLPISIPAKSSFSALIKSVIGNIHPFDRVSFASVCSIDNIVDHFADTDSPMGCDFRIRSSEDTEYRWHSVSFIIDREQYIQKASRGGKRVVMIIADATKRKDFEQRAAELRIKAEHDPLTGLYNRRAAQSLIDDFLQNEGSGGHHTLILCDLDNFKQVNDCFGHPFGDAFLASIADRLSSSFDPDDICCRIGGDEFVVLFKNSSGHSNISRHAEYIIDHLEQHLPVGDQTLSVSCSIGIACYPDDGTNYNELFSNADRAMYSAKTNGKRQYRFYDNTLSDGMLFTITKEFGPNSTPRDRRVRENICNSIFHSLYESTDLKQTLPLVLQLLGAHFGLSTVYLTEIVGDHLNVSYQWNAAGVAPVPSTLPNAGRLKDFILENIDDTSQISHCSDTSLLPSSMQDMFISVGIGAPRAFMHSLLHDRGRHFGSLLFLDNRSSRQWSDDDISIMSYVSRFISVFLTKQRALDDLDALRAEISDKQ